MTLKNIAAIAIIAIVLIGGAIALHYVDTGRGNRTSNEVSSRTASD